jgi:predicted metalloendopeptidase
MDKTVKPADFRYVNGTWLGNSFRQNSLGSFDELRQKTDADALAILKEAATNPKYKSDTHQGKAINLYKTILDTIGNKLGITPLKPYLKKLMH